MFNRLLNDSSHLSPPHQRTCPITPTVLKSKKTNQFDGPNSMVKIKPLMLALCLAFMLLFIFDVGSARAQLQEQQPLWSHPIGETVNWVFSVSISSDGSYIAAGGTDRRVYLFSKDSSTPLWSYQAGGGGTVYSVSISSDGSYIAAGSFDDNVYLFSRTSSTPLWSYQTDNYVYSVSISSDGSYIAAGSDLSKRVYLFSRTSSTPLWSYRTGGTVYSVSVSSNGSYIAAGGYDRRVYLFSREIQVQEKTSTTISISPSSFTKKSGESLTLVATLKDNANNPLANKTITWAKTAGSLSITSGTTDSAGQVLITYTTPSYETAVTVTASFGGDEQYQASSGSSSGTITISTVFEATLNFRKPDGSPLANTTIYYGFSSGQETNYLGTTDNEGKITTQENLGGRTVYFKTSDGRYTGSSSIGAFGGEVTSDLTEVSEFPTLWVTAAIATVVCGAIGAATLVKRRKGAESPLPCPLSHLHPNLLGSLRPHSNHPAFRPLFHLGNRNDIE